MRYLPDSTVLIHYSRGMRAATDWFASVLNTDEEVGVCAVNIAECYAGCLPGERPGWAEIFNRLAYWPETRRDAALAGIWKYDYARRGIQLHIPDLLIAAVAQRVGAVVVTANAKDFPMDDVRVLQLP
jgi:predicted nucleic acid-binding protein